MRARWGLLVAAGAVVVAAGGVAAATVEGRSAPRPQHIGAVARTSATSSDAAAGFRSARTHPVVALPVRLRIPAIGVDSPLVRLGLDAQGAVEVPSSWQEAGWYTGSARPGQSGPAVLLGHVDSTSGPAVFYRLAELRAGDAVQVVRGDGTRATFRVSGRMVVAKGRFPTDLVYAPTLEPSLRLVTCGGAFDAAAGHYRDNVIVSAVPG